MDKRRLRKCLEDEGLDIFFECYECLESTNIRARELSESACKDALVVSEEQTKGRGRRGIQSVGDQCRGQIVNGKSHIR